MPSPAEARSGNRREARSPNATSSAGRHLNPPTAPWSSSASRRCASSPTPASAFIVDALQNLTELENIKYHGFGTGTTAEAAADTALVTELTTEYATDNTRPTGTQTEPDRTARTSTAPSPPSTRTRAERGRDHRARHLRGNQAANSGGTLLDRSKFSAVNLDSPQGRLAPGDLRLHAQQRHRRHSWATLAVWTSVAAEIKAGAVVPPTARLIAPNAAVVRAANW
jgi:hypothetical protein